MCSLNNLRLSQHQKKLLQNRGKSNLGRLGLIGQRNCLLLVRHCQLLDKYFRMLTCLKWKLISN
jgi:hypothetical protein